MSYLCRHDWPWNFRRYRPAGRAPRARARGPPCRRTAL